MGTRDQFRSATRREIGNAFPTADAAYSALEANCLKYRHFRWFSKTAMPWHVSCKRQFQTDGKSDAAREQRKTKSKTL